MSALGHDPAYRDDEDLDGIDYWALADRAEDRVDGTPHDARVPLSPPRGYADRPTDRQRRQERAARAALRLGSADVQTFPTHKPHNDAARPGRRAA